MDYLDLILLTWVELKWLQPMIKRDDLTEVVDEVYWIVGTPQVLLDLSLGELDAYIGALEVRVAVVYLCRHSVSDQVDVLAPVDCTPVAIPVAYGAVVDGARSVLATGTFAVRITLASLTGPNNIVLSVKFMV